MALKLPQFTVKIEFPSPPRIALESGDLNTQAISDSSRSKNERTFFWSNFQRKRLNVSKIGCLKSKKLLIRGQNCRPFDPFAFSKPFSRPVFAF
jgi:hypothetical protein